MFRILEEKEINIKKTSLTYGNSTHTHGAKEIRRFGDNLMLNFLDYIATFPDDSDIAFMENLKEYDFTKKDFDINQLDKYLLKA